MGWHLLTQSFPPSTGWKHHPAAAEDCQEDGARGGVEQDPGGPEGHCGSAPAARRQGQSSSEGGEVVEEVFFFCHSDSLAQKEQDGKTTEQPLLTSVGGKIKRIWACLVAAEIRDEKNPKLLLWDFVEETVLH